MSKNRLASIDALRGIAALLVFWQHTSESFIRMPGVAEQGDFLSQTASTLDFGRIGVVCFFLVSGYVIPFSLKESGQGPIKRFVIRRLFRLYPAYWLSLAVMVMIAPLWGASVGVERILANSTMLQSFMGQPHVIGLYWTLQFELVFYLACIILFCFGLLKNSKAVFYFIVFSFSLFIAIQVVSRSTGLLAGVNEEFLYLPYYVSIMFLGSLYRKVYDASRPGRELCIYVLLATILCFGLAVAMLILSRFGIDFGGQSVSFGSSHCLAYLLFVSGLFIRVKIPRMLLWLGTISYSLYLFHPIVMKAMISLIGSSGIEQINGLHVSIYMITALIFTVILCSMIYLFIEKPAIYMGYFFSKAKEKRVSEPLCGKVNETPG